MRQPDSATPALHRLIGAYVNEDVLDFYSDAWAALDDFIAGTPEKAGAVPGEVTMLLEKYQTKTPSSDTSTTWVSALSPTPPRAATEAGS